jgi:Skp family chaperone for outer membrane proteins
MTRSSKILALASVSAATLFIAAAPAGAQVNGVGTVSTIGAIAQAKAMGDGYRQIETTYASNFTQLRAKTAEVQPLLAKLDTNGDKNVDQAEMTAAQTRKDPILTQVEQKQDELDKLREPIVRAQIYVVDQIVSQYGAAQQAVVTAKKLSFILSPEAFVWAPDTVDVTTAVVTELNRLVPVASTTPPSGWQPTQQIAQVYQQVQQLISAASQQAAARAPAAGTPAAAAAPATPAPANRPAGR